MATKRVGDPVQRWDRHALVQVVEHVGGGMARYHSALGAATVEGLPGQPQLGVAETPAVALARPRSCFRNQPGWSAAVATR